MRHRASPSFRREYNALDADIRKLADKSFQLFKNDPQYPSRRLKKTGRFWSARVGLQYRALSVEIPDGLLWFWIGDHKKYDRLVG